ncbi:MAG: hypothetical protein QM778_11940 [Myxococcales bacterium]
MTTEERRTQEEEAFRKALTRTNVRGTLAVWGPIMGSGVVAFAALLAVFTYWPFDAIPLYILGGVPMLAGAGAFLGLQKLLS